MSNSTSTRLRREVRQLDEQGHEDGREPARRHAVAEQPAGELREVLGEDHAVLEADSDPERDTGDQALPIVDPVMEDHLHADDEEHCQQHGEIGCGDRARYRQDHGERLGKERQSEEYRADGDADATGADPGEFGYRYTAGIGRIRHRARETGQQVPHSVRGHGTLHRPEIHRPGLAPGHVLNGDGVADCFDGSDQGHEDERRKKRPEHRPEVKIKARPCALRQTDP